MHSSFLTKKKSMQAENTQGRQTGIQALRAIACFLVLFQHITFFATYVKGLDYHPYLAINFGRIGVSLFFVISGYVMAECTREGARFMPNRLIRVLPPYWLAIAVSGIVLSQINPDWHFDWWSALLLPPTAVNNTYAIPYWTLCYELAFYAVTYAFVVMRFTQKKMLLACSIWLAAILMVDAYRPLGFVDDGAAFAAIAQPGAWILLTPYPIFFIVGFALAISKPDQFIRMKSQNLLLLAFTLWGISNGLKLQTSVPVFLIQAVAFCCVLLAMKNAHVSPLLAKLGDLSYGTYLMHMIPIVALSTIMKPHAQEIRLLLAWGILAAAGTLMGVMFGYLEFALHSRVIKPLVRARPRSLAESGTTE